jgi:signal transduction histidine kinase
MPEQPTQTGTGPEFPAASGLPADLMEDIAAIGAIGVVPAILDTVCRVTGMGFAAVARVTEQRWIACSVKDEIGFGLQPGGELKLETTICDEIRRGGTGVTIDHVAQSPHWSGHHTPALYGFQSYVSMPIFLPGGSFFGTLCAIDPQPAKVGRPEIIETFRLFADLIGFHLDQQGRLTETSRALKAAEEAGELREKFVAVLGHDLRNPLASLSSGTRLLARTAKDERSLQILGMMDAAVERMVGLIDNVLDFARGQFGGGLSVRREPDAPLRPALQQVVAEFVTTHPARRIETDLALASPVDCDPGRLAQLLSNLLANALTHGAEDRPVRVRASTDDRRFLLEVANAGPAIPPEVLPRLFQPFTRIIRPDQPLAARKGLGLGLYIASQIASAHGGVLTVRSDGDETVFSFAMDRSRPA